jgi:uncharacterized protein HemY
VLQERASHARYHRQLETEANQQIRELQALCSHAKTPQKQARDLEILIRDTQAARSQVAQLAKMVEQNRKVILRMKKL